VWIAGRHKLRERELDGMDVDAIVANAKQWRARIATIDRASL
jgi:5-methylthioadenosine/S-adenosylhomocysteine deaminase